MSSAPSAQNTCFGHSLQYLTCPGWMQPGQVTEPIIAAVVFVLLIFGQLSELNLAHVGISSAANIIRVQSNMD